ncbi:hypothetical protein PTTG_09157 [Puccinia triticina 1-1 BBBD Race 1]|uniref:TauD domain-containing protein n=2 Tax=Puccinia triticina TaxID=208348 RepID=A0A180G6H7_PUCT1|nr:uncharacterized protein PtA15_17A261 [Puccinia triticina]OAV88210.1 hypothetical protein PTTG_09157 [Puccinia triticina 1-1 BBBD Race 1]WAQ92779.1 hypothetical protein PtA15_17A261 [Puccinia triticina]WAR63678.1 hypothetical protein PtB15_17B279 [Puccinia triticina]
MALKTAPLASLAPPDSDIPQDFGVVVDLASYTDGQFDPLTMSDHEFKQLEELLYRHSIVLWRGVTLSPEQQFVLTNRFDLASNSYGHGTETSGLQAKSILHPDLKTLPGQPQVQLIGNGQVTDQAVAPGLTPLPVLKHPHHKTFHKDVISEEDEKKGHTRFYRWHIDAALYDLNPPKVTTLQALRVPQGAPQICRYDDGTGDELKVPLGTTVFVSGKKMFQVLPPELKSLAVRTSVQYSPHPYVWMSEAKAKSTGLGLETEGKELPRSQLPAVEEAKIKTFPVLWKNPVTGDLHLEVHPCGAEKLLIAPLPGPAKGADRALYPDGATIDDLALVRALLYKLQRPGIAPSLVYAHDWREKDLCLFHNRGVLHSVVGAFTPDQHRAFWQCNIAATAPPPGPDPADIAQYA